MSYRTCVLGGASLGIAIAAFFAESVLLWLAVAALAVSVALLLAAATKVLLGVERFSFLHYQLAAIACVAVVHAPSLDLLALALAIAQGIGRIGCAHAGCCHGRPFRAGIRYTRGHVAEHWVGARLIPVQWIESGGLLLLAVAVAFTIGNGAFVLYATSYAALRFMTELLRGDRRPHYAGLSEAQWICLATAIVLAPTTIAALLVVAAIAVMRMRRIDVDAFARAVHAARATSSVANAAGLRISHGRTGDTEHYTLSAVAPRHTRPLAALLRDLVHPDQRLTLLPRDGGVLHVIVGGAA